MTTYLSLSLSYLQLSVKLLRLCLSPLGVRGVVAPRQARVADLNVGPVGVSGELLQQRKGRVLHLFPVHTVVEHLWVDAVVVVVGL